VARPELGDPAVLPGEQKDLPYGQGEIVERAHAELRRPTATSRTPSTSSAQALDAALPSDATALLLTQPDRLLLAAPPA
jgi:hypothetical protein